MKLTREARQEVLDQVGRWLDDVTNDGCARSITLLLDGKHYGQSGLESVSITIIAGSVLRPVHKCSTESVTFNEE